MSSDHKIKYTTKMSNTRLDAFTNDDIKDEDIIE
jgi:hypothetical protein